MSTARGLKATEQLENEENVLADLATNARVSVARMPERVTSRDDFPSFIAV